MGGVGGRSWVEADKSGGGMGTSVTNSVNNKNKENQLKGIMYTFFVHTNWLK